MELSSSKWFPIGPAPTDTPGHALGHTVGRVDVAAADPGNVDTVYVGAGGGGIWKTGVWTRSDPVWLPFTDDQPSINIAGYHSLVVHPAHHETVFGLVSGPGAGVLKSTDFGVGWQLISNDLFEGASLHSIAVHPTDVNVIYVGVYQGGDSCDAGVYKTTDGGMHWVNTTAGVHDGWIIDVIIAKWDHKTLFAGMVADSNLGADTAAVYRSTDAGASWHSLGSGLPTGSQVRSFIRLESATEENRAYATIFTFDNSTDPPKDMVGRFHTTDGGNHWKILQPTPGPLENRAWHVLLGVDPKDGKHIFANDAYSLFESKDSGQTWKRADVVKGDPIGSDWINISFDASNDAVVTADQGVYHFKFGSNEWEHRCGNLQVAQLYTITVTPQDVDRCYGIAQDYSSAMKFKGSIEWHSMPAGGEFGKVLVDPANKKRLYVFDPRASQTELVQASTDGGKSWTVIHTDQSFDHSLASSVQRSFAMDPSNAKRLLLGLTKVFECKDATVANPVWKAISGVLSPSGQCIIALTIAESSGKVIYAATADGHVWTTTNDGGNWTQNDTGLLGPGVGKIVDIRVDPSNAKRVFGVTSGGGGSNIWFLDPADGTWKNISGNMPWNLGVVSIAVDWRFVPNVLYVGSARGVFRSLDLGMHWRRFGKDMPRTPVIDLQTLPIQDILAASTSGRGVFEILMSDPNAPKLAPPPEIKLPPRPAQLANQVAYEDVADLIRLPGKRLGQALGHVGNAEQESEEK